MGICGGLVALSAGCVPAWRIGIPGAVPRTVPVPPLPFVPARVARFGPPPGVCPGVAPADPAVPGGAATDADPALGLPGLPGLIVLTAPAAAFAIRRTAGGAEPRGRSSS